MLVDELFRPTIVGPAILITLYIFYFFLIKHSAVPENLPWVGRKTGILANFRANLIGIFNQLNIFTEGYDKYSKKGDYWVSPNIISGPVVILPQKDVKWVNSQPETVLDHGGPQLDLLSANYTMNLELLSNHDHMNVVKRDLTRQLGSLTEAIVDEIKDAFADNWGTDTENWVEVNPYYTMMRIVTRTANRIFVGLPLCQDPVFTTRCYLLAQSIAGAGFMLRGVPNWLKPAVAPFMTLPITWYTRKFDETACPYIQERLDEWNAQRENPSPEYEEPNDLLQWLINMAANRKVNNDPTDLTPKKLSVRLAGVVFTAIHTSTFTSTHAVYDLASVPVSENYLDLLRRECQDVLNADGGKWTKDGLDKMYGVDSTLRESQRINALSTTILRKRVASKEGVVLPDGSHAPKGTNIAIAVRGINYDERIHENPEVFNPLRFSRLRAKYIKDEQAKAAANGDAFDADDNLRHKNLSAVATSEEHLGFGHGKHACPGRFFAVNELKILIAYMLLHYDIEHMDKRPANNWFVDFSSPPMTVPIRIRRRKATGVVGEA